MAAQVVGSCAPFERFDLTSAEISSAFEYCTASSSEMLCNMVLGTAADAGCDYEAAIRFVDAYGEAFEFLRDGLAGFNSPEEMGTPMAEILDECRSTAR